MKGLTVFFLGFSFVFSPLAISKDLGVVGHTFGIVELNMIDWMKAKMNHLSETGELDKINKEFSDNVKKHAVRPVPVPGISTTTNPRTFTIDPTITVEKNIYGADGQIVVPKGKVVNPFKELKHPYRWKWAFIDADDYRQINWVKRVISKYPDSTKVVLVNGDISKANSELSHYVYFDQGGYYTDKLSIKHVPTLAKEDSFVWLVKEYNARDYQ